MSYTTATRSSATSVAPTAALRRSLARPRAHARRAQAGAGSRSQRIRSARFSRIREPVLPQRRHRSASIGGMGEHGLGRPACTSTSSPPHAGQRSAPSPSTTARAYHYNRGRMRHRPFNKIVGPGEPLGLVPGGPWVALEKIHGAQMVVAVGGDALRFGKRKAWLADEEPFFGWQLVRAGLADVARAAARELGAPRVHFYGELFGGGYPHPHVPLAPGLQPVQTGIWYAPDLRWAVFDALVARDDDDDGEFLAYHELAALARASGLLTPPLVRAGPRPHVEAAPFRFPTRVPALLGLPELDDNLAEGLVIRPDARGRPGARPVYKRKIAEFDELRFAGSEAWDPTQRPGQDALRAWARRLVNPARFASAASKVGRHDPAALLDELELDVLIDLAAAFPAALADLAPADEDALRAEVRAAAAALVV